jgi:carboxyl-terminal processing protease
MKKFIALLVVLMLVLSGVVAAVATEEELPMFTIDAFSQMWQMQNIISRNTLYNDVDAGFLYGVALREILDNHPELYEMAARAMLSNIDENSMFRTARENEEWAARLEREFGGIGVHVIQTLPGLLVTNVIEGSPAQRAGIMANDVIIEVDGAVLRGLTQDQSIRHVRGEVGSVAELWISRPSEADFLYFTMTRGILHEDPVRYTILEDYGILYLQIMTFNTRTDIYVEEALSAADEAGITKVLLDLRNNSGGFMDQAITVASNFVYGERAIVIESFNERREDEVHMSSLVDKKYDVVVLVNGLSASAAEIVAGAIQDNEVGLIVGTNTFGKATVQHWITMWWGDSITHTVAHYLTPNGHYIHQYGISPDVYVQNVFEDFDFEAFGVFSYAATYRVGDSGDDIRLARGALDVFNIYVEDIENDYFDESLRNAIMMLQNRTGLEESGELCPHTQVSMYIRLQNTQIMQDLQFEEGLRILREG